MSNPYIGEIRMFAGNFAPAGWALCEGQTMPISEYETLFNLIGTTYGGDGESTFNLPDLRGRFPLHAGNPFILAETGGVETVTLTSSQLPNHTHLVTASTSGTGNQDPTNGLLSNGVLSMYTTTKTVDGTLAPQAVPSSGGNQPHDNMHPYLAINFIISLFGIFPSQT